MPNLTLPDLRNNEPMNLCMNHVKPPYDDTPDTSSQGKSQVFHISLIDSETKMI